MRYVLFGTRTERGAFAPRRLTPEVTPTGSTSLRAGKNLATFGLSCRKALAISGGLSTFPRKMPCTCKRGPERRTGSRQCNAREHNLRFKLTTRLLFGETKPLLLL